MYLGAGQRHPADSSAYNSSIVPLDGNLETTTFFHVLLEGAGILYHSPP